VVTLRHEVHQGLSNTDQLVVGFFVIVFTPWLSEPCTLDIKKVCQSGLGCQCLILWPSTDTLFTTQPDTDFKTIVPST